MARIAQSLTFCTVLCSGQLVHAQQTPPSYDFDFATVGAAGNSAWGQPDPWNWISGRGRVDYSYRISRLEITTGQWLEFTNTYSVLGGSWTYFGEPAFWGARPDTGYSGPGMRWELDPSVPEASRLPVAGISWRTAAMYCYWLCNGQATATTALETGAYDTSTFGSGGGLVFTDQWTHNPGAQFWIPTLDEWMKAAYYDPNRFGPGQGGWWESSYGSNSAPVPGVPGEGQTSAGLDMPGFWEVPLGAYTEMQSPWGLWDTSGGAAEWTEDVLIPSVPTARLTKGSRFGYPGGGEFIWDYGQIPPGAAVPSGYGLRIASAIPGPSCSVIFASASLLLSRRRRMR
jgi:hypothetical protein